MLCQSFNARYPRYLVATSHVLNLNVEIEVVEIYNGSR